MKDEHNNMQVLKERLDEIDAQLLGLISERGRIVKEIGSLDKGQDTPLFDPGYELTRLERLLSRNEGPFDNAVIKGLFKQLFQASKDLYRPAPRKELLVSRKNRPEDTVIQLRGVTIGGGSPVMIAGPCSVESYEQLRTVAQSLVRSGVKVMRGGAFKPRSSPYDFQGLGMEGLRMLKEVADEFGLVTISEIVHPNDIGPASEYIDVIQIGARNMQNFELLKEAGGVSTPILLKRGLAATLEEFLLASEYIVSRGNSKVMLIERGIRTYEKWTRNTLDISAVPILKQESHLPVLVDVTHSTGRKDILVPCAKAALAAGADGVMVEVHPNPPAALSDAGQQLDIPQFEAFFDAVKTSGLL